MEEVVLVIHIFLAVSIIGLVLLQRSEGGGLGIGGSGGGLGGMASAKSMNNFLTKGTTLCAIGFFTTSLLLGILAGRETSGKSILDSLNQAAPAAMSAAAEDQDQTITIKDDGGVPEAETPEAPKAE